MKVLRILPLLLCLSVIGWAQEQPAPDTQDPQANTTEAKQKRSEATLTPAQREVLQASERLREAMLKSDPDQLRNVLAMNYTGVDLMGRRIGRFEAVENIAFSPLRFDKVEINTNSIQVGDGTAVQSGNAYIQGTQAGRLFNTTYHFTRQWQRVDGEWKLVSTMIQGLGGAF